MVAAQCRVPWEIANQLLHYLCGERVQLFRPWFGYEDSFGQLTELTADDVKNFLEGRAPLFDAESGAELAPEQVYIYYRGLRAFRELTSARE